ncbi:sodium-dependent transporter [Jeotgalibacillus sp. R-1-5s-1]|uniref:sodium-dependent transporter n=1 Tax=Jeotgalibacillus sp. R-1-5s-1 TaxID=2555897 RepID=UPI00106C611D|nr:sodium-dependent transporter [Jeotgalibacillus sp. R-1-5s-1]TFD95950.1 sodium-dependent transporter [Jeotgalibacillus sp. R-1-5s-1]
MSNQQWSSKLGFVLAAAGSAIGLGAIWKFPYMAGSNGGSIFLLLFILFTILIAGPILLAEFVIGRRGKADAVTTFKKLAPGTAWPFIGIIGTIIAIIILSFYSVVGGWILSYLWRSVTGGLSGLTQAEYGGLFESIIANPAEVLIAQALFMTITIWVVQSGIQNGIERASKIMMPALLLMFVLLAVRSLTLDGAMEGIEYLFIPDWSYFDSNTMLLALGQSFFALSVGVSVMITYASYLKDQDNLGRSTASVAILNIVISLLAGIVIFPAVFALGFEPGEGPGLVFVVLPAIFNELAFGGVFMFVFLVLLLFATLTSAFSILEIVTATFSRGQDDKRKKYAWISGILIFIVGLPSALSFGVFSDVTIAGYIMFDFADYITSSFGLPLGALLISLFVGYKLKKEDVFGELSKGAGGTYRWMTVWYVLIKVVAPLAIILIFLEKLNII